MSDSFKPGTYAKGDSKRTANTPSQAVALEFEGYKRVEDAEAKAPVAPPAPVTPSAPVPQPPAAKPQAPSKPQE